MASMPPHSFPPHHLNKTLPLLPQQNTPSFITQPPRRTLSFKSWARKTFIQKQGQEPSVQRNRSRSCSPEKLIRHPHADDRITVVFPNPSTGVVSPNQSSHNLSASSSSHKRSPSYKARRHHSRSRSGSPKQLGSIYPSLRIWCEDNHQSVVHQDDYPLRIERQSKHSHLRRSYEEPVKTERGPQRRWSTPSSTPPMFKSSKVAKEGRKPERCGQHEPALSEVSNKSNEPFQSDSFAVYMPTTREPIISNEPKLGSNPYLANSTPAQVAAYEHYVRKVKQTTLDSGWSRVEDVCIIPAVGSFDSADPSVRGLTYTELEALTTSLQRSLSPQPSLIARKPVGSTSKMHTSRTTAPTVDSPPPTPPNQTASPVQINPKPHPTPGITTENASKVVTTPPASPPPLLGQGPPVAARLHLVSKTSAPSWHSRPTGTAVRSNHNQKSPAPTSFVSSSTSISHSTSAQSNSGTSTPISSSTSGSISTSSAATTPPQTPSPRRIIRAQLKPILHYRSISEPTPASAPVDTLVESPVKAHASASASAAVPPPSFATVVAAAEAYISSLASPIKPYVSCLPSLYSLSSVAASLPDAESVKNKWDSFCKWIGWVAKCVVVLWVTVLLIKVIDAVLEAIWLISWPARLILRFIWKVGTNG